MVFYYGVDEPGMTRLSKINYSDCDRAVELTSFFEGDDDHIPVTAGITGGAGATRRRNTGMRQSAVW